MGQTARCRLAIAVHNLQAFSQGLPGCYRNARGLVENWIWWLSSVVREQLSDLAHGVKHGGGSCRRNSLFRDLMGQLPGELHGHGGATRFAAFVE